MNAPVIRRRLTLLHGATVVAVLLAAVLVLERALASAIDRELERELSSALAFARGFYLIERTEFTTADAAARHIVGEVVFPDRRIEFVQPSGAVIAADPRQVHGAPASIAPPVIVREAPLDDPTAPGWRIRLHASAAEVAAVQRRLDLWLLACLPPMVLLGIAAGWWLTGRALRPVGDMADAAEVIGVDDPQARLPVADPRDELGRLGTRFNALLDRLQGALAQQKRFIADAEHELRTPIARMRNAVEVALRDPAGASDRATLEAIAADLRRGSTLLGELLLLAEADARPTTVLRERRYLDDVVLDALAPWRPDAARQGVTLGVSVIEETSARLDPALIERLVGILVDNAIRYTPAGGTVDVRVRREADRALLEVEDTGIGIPEAERERVFERFFRGREARRAAPDGSGLGLSIARWIVERHGGTLTIEPRPGGGTLARASLPAA
jgi:signal transduction histidine kinase